MADIPLQQFKPVNQSDYFAAVSIVTLVTGATDEHITLKNRGVRAVAASRQLVYWILSRHGSYSASAIGVKLNRERSCVGYGIKLVEAKTQNQFAFFEKVSSASSEELIAASQAFEAIERSWQSFADYWSGVVSKQPSEVTNELYKVALAQWEGSDVA